MNDDIPIPKIISRARCDSCKTVANQVIEAPLSAPVYVCMACARKISEFISSPAGQFWTTLCYPGPARIREESPSLLRLVVD